MMKMLVPMLSLGMIEFWMAAGVLAFAFYIMRKGALAIGDLPYLIPALIGGPLMLVGNLYMAYKDVILWQKKA